ncbi:MAG TPA: aminotransferase class V-fold PLP-dependent enzyme [Elusimicrobiota bacterium]|nr:aminotransferase class V-fold PLP-dependent enzyme [Elusimicrobiota bacterium]
MRNSGGIYFDNAATSFPKPPAVLAAMVSFQKKIGASAGRGVYPRAVETGRILASGRRALARLLNVADERRLVFTLNATDGLSLAVKGLPWKRGDRALISPYEHNSVLRPLHELKKRVGVGIDVMPVDGEGRVIVEKLPAALRPRTRLVACVHASNVTGVIQPVEAVGRFARSRGIPLLIDAAQSAGALPVDVRAFRADFLAFPGHKGLLGPLGTGALYIRPGRELQTLREGGTGSVSEVETQPLFLPDRYESGSHNALGIAGLLASATYVRRRGVSEIRRHELELTEHFLEELRRMRAVRYFGPRAAEDRVAVVSLRVGDRDPLAAARALWRNDGIMVRAGLHCAPWAHRHIGTFPHGTVRFSLGPFNTHRHIEKAVAALQKLI